MKNASLVCLSVLIASSMLLPGCSGRGGGSLDGGVDSGVFADAGDAALDGSVPDDGSLKGDGGYFTCDEDAGNPPVPWCGGSGDSCTSDDGCCLGLHCNNVSGKCEACGGAGSACASDAWCCQVYFCGTNTSICVLCATQGGVCSSNRDCCNGTYCDTAEKKCAACKQPDVSCSSEGECCDGTFCIGGKCRPCQGEGGGCAISINCCGDLVCSNGKCTGACVPVGGDCFSDLGCCASADPAKGVWCDTSSMCSECSRVDGPCTNDYDCCPPDYYGETSLLCSEKGTCLNICRMDRDCPEGQSCMANNTCSERPCSSDSECGGKRCCSGTCKDECGYGTPDGCRITSIGGAVFGGQKIKLHAAAYKGDPKSGGMLVPWVAVTWASSDPDAVSVDSSGNVTGGAKVGAAEISASVAGKTCDNKIKYFSHRENDNGSLVLVFDEKTGLPVSGAKVVVNGVQVVTDSNGSASAATTGDIHVFHPDHNYVSVIGVQRNNYIIHLPPKSRDGKAGGYRGAFDFDAIKVDASGIQGGCAATSVSSGLFDVSKTDMTGQPILTHITFSQPVKYDNWEWVGSGLMEKDYYFGKPDLLPSYRVSGEGGFRVATAIAGRVPPRTIKDLIPVMTSMMGQTPFPLNKYYGFLHPIWSRFKHVVRSAFDVVPLPQIPTTCKNGKTYGDPGCDKAIFNGSTMPDYQNFPELNHDQAVSLGLKIKTREPVLPKYKNACLDAVELLSVSDVPGAGLVPTGFSIGMTDIYGPSNDCRVTYVDGLNPFKLAKNEMMLFSAPNHHGLETSGYAIIEAAVKFDMINDPVLPDRADMLYSLYVPASTAVSIKLTRMESIPREIDLTRPFLGFADGSDPDVAKRTIAVPSEKVEGASLYMYRILGQMGDWIVYTPTDKDPRLPAVPKGMDDYLAEASKMNAYAIQLDRVTLGNLVSSCGTVHLDGLKDVTSAFSRVPVSMY